MFRSGITAAFVLHGVRTAAELYYGQFLSTLPATYVACLSEASASESLAASVYAGKVTGYIKIAWSAVRTIFICAAARTWFAIVTLLADEHFPASHIYTEVFY